MNEQRKVRFLQASALVPIRPHVNTSTEMHATPRKCCRTRCSCYSTLEADISSAWAIDSRWASFLSLLPSVISRRPLS